VAEYKNGDRVVLDRTDDRWTKLNPGDKGTVLSYDPVLGTLFVNWDSGSALSMLLGEGDKVHLENSS